MRGSIKPRVLKNGQRVWDVRADGPPRPDGGRRQLWFRGFLTRKAAEAKLTELLATVERGTFAAHSRQTLSEFLHEWLEATRATLRRSTHDSYSRLVERYIVPRIGGVRLQALVPATLNAFYADLLADGRTGRDGGLSPRTVRYVHAILHKALSDGIRWNRLARNVADQADPPKPRTPEMRRWSAEELRTFLDHIRDDRMYAAFLLCASTGMRRGEVLGLGWPDVDIEARRVQVRRSLVTVGYRLLFEEPKTAKGKRQVAIDNATVAALREHRKHQAEERLAWGPAWRDEGLVFTREDGSPIHPDYFSKTFDLQVKGSQIPRIRLHDLRHTHATLALQAGVHPKVVSERLGHATVSLTLDTYSHAIPALQEEAADTVARLIFGG